MMTGSNSWDFAILTNLQMDYVMNPALTYNAPEISGKVLTHRSIQTSKILYLLSIHYYYIFRIKQINYIFQNSFLVNFLIHQSVTFPYTKSSRIYIGWCIVYMYSIYIYMYSINCIQMHFLMLNIMHNYVRNGISVFNKNFYESVRPFLYFDRSTSNSLLRLAYFDLITSSSLLLRYFVKSRLICPKVQVEVQVWFK